MEDIGLGESSSLTEKMKFASVFLSAECAPENLPQRVFLAHCCSSLLMLLRTAPSAAGKLRWVKLLNRRTPYSLPSRNVRAIGGIFYTAPRDSLKESNG